MVATKDTFANQNFTTLAWLKGGRAIFKCAEDVMESILSQNFRLARRDAVADGLSGQRIRQVPVARPADYQPDDSSEALRGIPYFRQIARSMR